MTILQRLLAEHFADPFPPDVDKGIDYGEVNSVMIGADIFGWASRVHDGETLNPIDEERLRLARDELMRSLSAFPPTARPYYEKLVELGTAALKLDERR